jgi:hypothetical protein
MLRNIDQMETGILITKLSIVLNALNYGNLELKRAAREEYKHLSEVVARHIDPHAFRMAAMNLGFTKEEMNILEQPITI